MQTLTFILEVEHHVPAVEAGSHIALFHTISITLHIGEEVKHTPTEIPDVGYKCHPLVGSKNSFNASFFIFHSNAINCCCNITMARVLNYTVEYTYSVTQVLLCIT